MQQHYEELISWAALFAVACGVVWLRRRREAPLRREVRAQGITFQAVVKAKMMNTLGSESSFRNEMNLVVRADSFEISIGFAPVRIVMGMEYYFKAAETTIELRHVTPKMPGMKAQDWIVAKTQHSGRDLQISFTNYNYTNTSIPAVWDALVMVGAIPIGPPPKGSLITGGPRQSDVTNDDDPPYAGKMVRPRLFAWRWPTRCT
jgi:hypothetical protein